jgi:hypothetical protein
MLMCQSGGHLLAKWHMFIQSHKYSTSPLHKHNSIGQPFNMNIYNNNDNDKWIILNLESCMWAIDDFNMNEMLVLNAKNNYHKLR